MLFVSWARGFSGRRRLSLAQTRWSLYCSALRMASLLFHAYVCEVHASLPAAAAAALSLCLFG